jgi:predicted aspartyl protease
MKKFLLAGVALAALVPSANATDWVCGQPTIYVGKQSKDAKDTVVEITIHRDNQDGWQVHHRLGNGLIAEREFQYQVQEISNQRQTAWEGRNYKYPILTMKGEIRQNPQTGQPMYIEWLYKNGMLDMNAAALCTQQPHIVTVPTVPVIEVAPQPATVPVIPVPVAPVPAPQQPAPQQSSNIVVNVPPQQAAPQQPPIIVNVPPQAAPAPVPASQQPNIVVNVPPQQPPIVVMPPQQAAPQQGAPQQSQATPQQAAPQQAAPQQAAPAEAAPQQSQAAPQPNIVINPVIQMPSPPDPVVTQKPQRDSVPITLEDRGVILNVGLGTETVSMVLDTGANTSAITETVANNLVNKGPAHWRNSKTYVLADRSETSARSIDIDVIRIGNHIIRNANAGVVADGSHVLLGFPAINQIGPFTINTRTRELVFEADTGQYPG